MGLVSVALDLAQSLRRPSHAKAGGDPFAAIPTAVIQSLLHKTDIARAEISLHALESAGELKKIVRGTGSTLHACCARESFDLLFTSPHGGPSSGPLTVGKVAFSLSRSVSTDERYALGVFATFLADHVATALERDLEIMLSL